MNENSIHDKVDSQIIIKEINILKEKLRILKQEKITQKNINLFQQLDEELTNKLFEISSCSK